MQLKTNIGKLFFNLLLKHFPREHLLHKIFNRNTIKLSYSCTDNLERIIKKHNSKIIRKSSAPKEEETRDCNCYIKNACPLQNKCLTKNVVYKATVSVENEEDKYYIGIAHTTFKDRLYNHRNTFKYTKGKKKTSLATYIWKLEEREDDTPYNIKWEIITQV